MNNTDNKQFAVLNLDGVDKMIAAIETYAQAVNSVNFSSTIKDLSKFNKKSSASNALITLMENSDQQMTDLVNQKLQALINSFNDMGVKPKKSNSNSIGKLKSVLKS